MIIGVLRESYPEERRVALIPASLAPLIKDELQVWIESGAGVSAGFPDSEYEGAGARIVTERAELLSKADVLLQVRSLGSNTEHGRADLEHHREGQVVIGFHDPLSEPKAVEDLAVRKVVGLSMELMPRISRAQSMDALSAMATIAGYKAVLMAANSLPRMFPMLMTAAGTVKPARVLIVGVGVAGLQAIASARRLGAVVSAYDIRPAAKEQVESLGAKFVELPMETGATEDSGGYAKAMDDAFYKRQRELMAEAVAHSNVVITTAAVPGKRAPVLVTEDMVRGMSPGSVLLDLAAERGGNCEITEPGKTVERHGVQIIGPLNVPSDVPYHASQMYAKNIVTFLRHLTKDAELKLDTDDEITRETLLTRDGEVVHERVREILGLPVKADTDAAKKES
jgi:NAD(P) transhydrogenase subunit alpha